MNALDEILGNSPNSSTSTLIDNWQTAFIWLVLGIIVFALVVLVLGIKRVAKGENVNKGMLPYVKWPLLFASAGFNVFFTYYVFLPAGQAVAGFAAVVMGGVNLAEAYLVRLIIATWRHDMKLVFRLALLFTVPVFMYSLMSAGSSFSTMMKKNQDSLIASQLELESAKDRIGQAQSEVKEAEAGEQSGNILSALYQTDVRNSRGVRVGFNQVKNSCDSGGYYARNYPELCNQYRSVRDGTHTAQSVASANTQALATSASEKLNMAQIIKDRPPEITPTLLGFGLGIAAVGFIVSLALESAIIGVGFFEELFIKPTPLPAIVSFMNKSLDWDANTITQRGLQVDISPSPGAVNFSKNGQMASPFSAVGWSPKNPSISTLTGNRLKSPSSPDGLSAPAQLNTPNPSKNAVSVPAQSVRTSPDSSDISVPAQENEPIQSAPAHDEKEQGEKVDLNAIKERLELAHTAKVGEMFGCVFCGEKTLKRIDTKRFCGKQCRNDFRKVVKPKGERVSA